MIRGIVSDGTPRIRTDKNADVLWVGNSSGHSLNRIGTRTMETTIVPLPVPTATQPYYIVDRGLGNLTLVPSRQIGPHAAVVGCGPRAGVG